MAKKWTPEEEKYLIKHYGKIPNKELGDHFGVSAKAVANKMYSLRDAEIATATKTIKPKPAKKKSVKKKAVKKKTQKAPEQDTIVPLSSLSKKKSAAAKTKTPGKDSAPEEPPEYIPTTIMIMTENGWKPVKIDKRRIKS
jgi:hypothetical protein